MMLARGAILGLTILVAVLAVPTLPTSHLGGVLPATGASGVSRATDLRTAQLSGLGGPAGCNVTPPFQAGFSLAPYNATEGFAPGPIPLNVTAIPYARGGVPPYTEQWNFGDGSPTITATGPIHHTYTYAGVFEVSLTASDSAGSADAQGLEVRTWGAAGPDPIQINVSQASGLVPVTVTFEANASAAPAGAQFAWMVLPAAAHSTVNRTNLTATFDQPGGAWALLTTSYPNGTMFSQTESPVVLVNPRVNLSVAANTTLGVSPLSTTFWGNVSNISGVNYSTPYQIEWSFSDPIANASNNTAVGPVVHHTFNELYAELPVQAEVVDPSGVILAETSIEVTIDWNGSSSFPDPILSMSVSPSNGTSPLSVNGTTFAFGGAAPYNLSVYALGPLSPSGFGACAVIVQQPAWTGRSLSWAYTFNGSGDYRVYENIVDSSGVSGIFATAMAPVTVTSPGPIAPMSVQADRSVANGTGNATATFTARVLGGDPPYTVQWQFGDHTFGSSEPGRSFLHEYISPGSYTPILTVRDSRGDQAISALPPVVVAGSPGTSSSQGPPGSFGPGSFAVLSTVAGRALVAIVALVVAAAVVELWTIRRKRQGLRWVRELESECAAYEGPAPPR